MFWQPKFINQWGLDQMIVASAWLFHNPIVTSSLIGPRTVEQLIKTIRSIDYQLDIETLNRLNEIWPGPGGEAPQAYAW